MNSNTSEQTAPQADVSRTIKFVLMSFLFFFLVMGLVSLGDLARALLR